MSQIPIEEYFEKLRKSSPEYQWPLKRAAKEETKRDLIHKEFLYVITYSGMYGPGYLLDDMQDWCREKFGDRHGECYWRECEWEWDRWHEEVGLEAQLDKELYSNSGSRGPRPDRDKDPEAWDKWQEIGDKIIDNHFKMVEKRLDAPGEHCHWGTWTSHFVCKIGYDEGYEDFCFKNISDAVYFKLIWHEEAERRG